MQLIFDGRCGPVAARDSKPVEASVEYRLDSVFAEPSAEVEESREEIKY